MHLQSDGNVPSGLSSSSISCGTPTTARASATGMEESLYCPPAYNEYKVDFCILVNATAMTESKWGCMFFFDVAVEFMDLNQPRVWTVFGPLFGNLARVRTGVR